jgi:CheY-like chemotaxis protein
MPDARKLRVLLVDDDKVARRLLGHMLTALGHEVVSAPDGRKALEIFVSTDGFNLVMTDINMPLMNGWEFALHVSEIKPEIPILAVTGNEPGSVNARLPASPICHALFKPFNLSVLQKALETLITCPV